MAVRVFSLPAVPLLFSVIFSSVTLGLTLLQARALPLPVVFNTLTIIYYSMLLVSSLLNHDREERAIFYIHPSEGPQIIGTFGIAAFWLLSSSARLKVFIENTSQDSDYILAFLGFSQWLLNAYLAIQSLVGLRDQFSRRIDLETGQTSDVILSEIQHLQILYSIAYEQEIQLTNSVIQCGGKDEKTFMRP